MQSSLFINSHISQKLRLSPRERLRLRNVADLYEVTRKKPRVARVRQRPHVRYNQGVEPGIRGLTIGDFEPGRVSGPRPPRHNPGVEFAPKTCEDQNKPEKLASAGANRKNRTVASKPRVCAHRERYHHFELHYPAWGCDNLPAVNVVAHPASRSVFVLIVHQVCMRPGDQSFIYFKLYTCMMHPLRIHFQCIQ